MTNSRATPVEQAWMMLVLHRAERNVEIRNCTRRLGRALGFRYRGDPIHAIDDQSYPGQRARGAVNLCDNQSSSLVAIARGEIVGLLAIRKISTADPATSFRKIEACLSGMRPA